MTTTNQPETPLWTQGVDAVVAATPDDQWRSGEAPNYHLTDITVPKERSRPLDPGSLDDLVENLVRVFEMEISHKTDPATWLSVAGDRFRMKLNSGEWVNGEQVAEQGSYNVLAGNSDFYDPDAETFESQHATFHTALSEGFFWEVTQVLAGPPNVTFKWRHWGRFTGEYKGHQPSGELIEMFGVSVATVTDDLKIVDLEHFYDPNDLLRPLAGGCPVR